MNANNYLKTSTNRFSDRVKYYLKYRPKYPVEIRRFLAKKISLTPSKTIADIGCGTGFFAELFLKTGNPVFGVEPNVDMLRAGISYCSEYSQFIPIHATAEETTLRNESVDVVTAATAFHWFDVDEFKNECRRILRKNGHIVIAANKRKNGVSAFMGAYEKMISDLEGDYKEVRNGVLDQKRLDDFFGTSNYGTAVFTYVQTFSSFEALLGRLLSGSYTPLPGQDGYNLMVLNLQELYDHYAINGEVSFYYDSCLWFSQISNMR